MDLQSLARQYAAEHPALLSPSYTDQLRWVVSSFGGFLGRPATTEDCDAATVTAYLQWLLSRHRSPWTVATRRRVMGVLARYAVSEGLLEALPAPKRVRQPRLAPRCWTPEEIRRLVAAARQLPGRFPRIDAARGPYMASLIMAAYDSGLRLGDLLALQPHQIAPDGLLTVRQSKTGREVIRRLSAATLAEIPASGAEHRRLVWPLWSDRSCLYRVVRQLVRAAGITPGSLRWLRRSGITAICREHGLDAATRFADHRDARTTVGHYVDEGQLGDLPQPPELF